MCALVQLGRRFATCPALLLAVAIFMNPWTLGGWGQVLYCGPFFFVINRAAAAADGTRLSSLYPAAQLDLLEFKDQTVGQESFDTIMVRWTLLEMNEINAAVINIPASQFEVRNLEF